MSRLGDKKEFTFIWKIENFSMLPHQTGEALVSPWFVVGMWKGIEWNLEIYPRGFEDKDYLSCSVGTIAKERKSIKVNVSWTLESTISSREKTLKMVYDLEERSRGWPKFSLSNEIYENNCLYLPQDILSIRCHLTPMDSIDEESTLNDNTECASNFEENVRICRTGIRVKHRSIKWSIENVRKRTEPVEIFLNEMIKDSPGLKMKLNLSEIADNIIIPIEIQQTAAAPLDEIQERLFVKCKITIVGVKNEYRDSKEGTYLFKSPLFDAWHFPQFLKTSNLTRGKYLNQEDTLVLQCDFAFSYKSGVYHWDSSEGPFAFGSRKEDETDNWCTSVQNLCASGKISDVQLKAGDETFRTHKLLLCARSSVFDAKFENDMEEKNSDIVKINDIDSATLERMLEFINFDEIKEKDISLEEVCKLYEAADKYDMASLESWCAKSLISSLCVENVCDILVLADSHHDDFLMTGVCNFICCHEKETIDSPNWDEFMQSNPMLSAEIVRKVLLSKNRN